MDKYWLVTFVETYDGYEWREKCLVTTNHNGSKKNIFNMSETELAQYGFDIGSEVAVDDVKELTKEQYDVLVQFI